MHSFRALARAAPRATARLTASSARASIRPAFTNSIRTQAPRAITAAFSTSRPTFDASSQELAAKLTSELSIESENAESTASDSNVQNFLGRTDWQLHDVDGEQIVKLSRKFEDELIEVRFTIADFNNPYPEHEDADEALMDDEMDFPEGQSGGAHTKGAINQGNNRSDGNFKVAPEDSIAPADREGLRDEEVRLRRDLDTAIAILIHSSRTTPTLLSPPTSTS
jgi:complement component 1 Q subcomponent-binding protein